MAVGVVVAVVVVGGVVVGVGAAGVVGFLFALGFVVVVSGVVGVGVAVGFAVGVIMNTNYGPMKLEEYAPGKFRMVGGGVEGHASTLGARGRLVTRREPVSSSAPPPSEYDSKLEAARGNYLGYLVLAGDIKKVVHHPFTVPLADKRTYTPDFLVWWKDGKITMEEIKGSVKSKNARDSITRLHVAAAMYPMFEWLLVLRLKGQWEERKI